MGDDGLDYLVFGVDTCSTNIYYPWNLYCIESATWCPESSFLVNHTFTDDTNDTKSIAVCPFKDKTADNIYHAYAQHFDRTPLQVQSKTVNATIEVRSTNSKASKGIELV